MDIFLFRSGARGAFPSAYVKPNPEHRREERKNQGLKAALKQHLSGATLQRGSSSGSPPSRLSLRSVSSLASSMASSAHQKGDDGKELGRFKVEYYGSTEIEPHAKDDETLSEAIMRVRLMTPLLFDFLLIIKMLSSLKW